MNTLTSAITPIVASVAGIATSDLFVTLLVTLVGLTLLSTTLGFIYRIGSNAAQGKSLFQPLVPKASRT